MSAVLELAESLVRRASVTPDDAGCQPLIAERLARHGFECEHLRFGEVDNLWARRGGAGPTLCFLGHTDVVPTGPLQAWHSPPFEPTLRDGLLYGRGAADMKGSVAAFVCAMERWAQAARGASAAGSVALLLTSDEEGPAIDGTVRVLESLAQRGQNIDWCVVGEPSSESRLGDIIKPGRRGSLGLSMTVRGVQGHVAYPQLANNPIHAFARALAELQATEWDAGNAHFPPTSFQVSNVNAGTGATNVIPGVLEAQANFRFSTESSAEQLKSRLGELLERHQVDADLDWTLSGEPFLTESGALVDAVSTAVLRHTGSEPQLSTAGGTSDGRFVAPYGAQIVELGPVNASIHQVNEHVRIADLDVLSAIYEGVMTELVPG